jgi:hypothetical protein
MVTPEFMTKESFDDYIEEARSLKEKYNVSFGQDDAFTELGAKLSRTQAPGSWNTQSRLGKPEYASDRELMKTVKVDMQTLHVAFCQSIWVPAKIIATEDGKEQYEPEDDYVGAATAPLQNVQGRGAQPPLPSSMAEILEHAPCKAKGPDFYYEDSRVSIGMVIEELLEMVEQYPNAVELIFEISPCTTMHNTHWMDIVRDSFQLMGYAVLYQGGLTGADKLGDAVGALPEFLAKKQVKNSGKTPYLMSEHPELVSNYATLR